MRTIETRLLMIEARLRPRAVRPDRYDWTRLSAEELAEYAGIAALAGLVGLSGLSDEEVERGAYLVELALGIAGGGEPTGGTGGQEPGPSSAA